MSQHILRGRFRDAAAPWLFVGPWLLGLVTLVAFPFAASFVLSFCRYDMLSAPQYVGLHNYQRLAQEIAAGEGFARALYQTAYYALLAVPLSIAVGIALAVMLSWNVRGRSIYRTVFFLPSVVPIVATSVLWIWLLDPNDGLVNWVLSWFGLPPQLWLKGHEEVLWTGRFGSKDALVLMSLWGVGNFMIIYLAAIGDVPRQLYEAAQLDGAGPVRRFRHVTLPLLTPVIFFNLVMGLIQSVQAFTQIYIVSEGTGQPAGSLLVLSLFVFLSAFADLDMGYASAVAWVLFVLLVVATAALFRWSRAWVHYQGMR
jgi:multiple sugar transport system permease protein